MIVHKYVEPELELYRTQCNFVGLESEIFEMRSKGIGLDRIADIKHDEGYTYDTIKKTSQAVSEKMRRVRNYFGI